MQKTRMMFFASAATGAELKIFKIICHFSTMAALIKEALNYFCLSINEVLSGKEIVSYADGKIHQRCCMPGLIHNLQGEKLKSNNKSKP